MFSFFEGLSFIPPEALLSFQEFKRLSIPLQKCEKIFLISTQISKKSTFQLEILQEYNRKPLGHEITTKQY
jgi:hypothetical protein